MGTVPAGDSRVASSTWGCGKSPVTETTGRGSPRGGDGVGIGTAGEARVAPSPVSERLDGSSDKNRMTEECGSGKCCVLRPVRRRESRARNVRIKMNRKIDQKKIPLCVATDFLSGSRWMGFSGSIATTSTPKMCMKVVIRRAYRIDFYLPAEGRIIERQVMMMREIGVASKNIARRESRVRIRRPWK